VNAVGYVNAAIPTGFSIISNPLNSGENKVGGLFSGTIPNGSAVYKFDASTGNFAVNSFLFGNWSDANMTLSPGEGAYFFNAGSAVYTNTFVGEVAQGTLTTKLPAGFSMASSQVPQQGLISTDLGFPASSGDTVYLFRAGNFEVFSQFFGSWSPSEPTVAVAEGFWVSKVAATDWTREFSVNN
jgi:hypothetical protein